MTQGLTAITVSGQLAASWRQTACTEASSALIPHRAYVVAPALHYLILVLRGKLDRREGGLLTALYVAYIAAAVRSDLGMAG